MRVDLCGMRVKTLSKPKCVCGRAELPTCVCVLHWKSCWCLWPCPKRACDADQRQVVIVLCGGHGLVRLSVSVSCSTVSVGCVLTFRGPCHVSSSLWPHKPSFCYSIITLYTRLLSVLLEILVSSLPLEAPCLVPTYPMTDSSLIAFLPSAFQAQYIQVGSVYIVSTSEKLELLSKVGLMVAQVTIFSFWEVSWSSVLLSATLLSWDTK